MSSANLINVENPYEYGCRVEGYSLSHSQLGVYVGHDTKKEKFYVDFDRVACFSGPMRWRNAILRLGSNEEYLQFMRQMMPLSKLTDEELVNPIHLRRLYIFEGMESPVKLVALHHEIVDRLTG